MVMRSSCCVLKASPHAAYPPAKELYLLSNETGQFIMFSQMSPLGTELNWLSHINNYTK